MLCAYTKILYGSKNGEVAMDWYTKILYNALLNCQE